MAHTPGPWESIAKLSGSENHRGFSIVSPRQWVLATVIPIDQDGIEGAANARLMATAPNLKFQLLAAANYIDCLGGDSRSYRQAIAEAEGKA